MKGGRWRAGGSVFTVAVLVIGTLVVASARTGRSAESTASYAGIRRLVVDNPGGTLTVRGGGDTLVSVRRRSTWSLAAPSLDDRRDGETLTLRAVCGGTGAVRITVSCEVAYELEVPPGIALTATAAGAVDIVGVTGPISVTGARGPVTIRSRG